MTYSIVARDEKTGDMGVAVQSHWFSVGSVVTWAKAGVGAVATQAFAEPAYGPRGLALLRAGLDAATALAALTAADAQRERRQVAILDSTGHVAAHTGATCIADAGHVVGDSVSVQANMMRNASVWPAMLDAYQSNDAAFADRLLAALDAGERAGGDVRGRQSAAMLIVRGTSSGQPWRDVVLELRVEDSADPLGELRRLLTLRRGYGHMQAAEEREAVADVAGALQEYQSARALLRTNDEASFWTAVFLASADRFDEARAMLRDICSREAGWATLLQRLPDVGMLPGGEATARRLLEE